MQCLMRLACPSAWELMLAGTSLPQRRWTNACRNQQRALRGCAFWHQGLDADVRATRSAAQLGELEGVSLDLELSCWTQIICHLELCQRESNLAWGCMGGRDWAWRWAGGRDWAWSWAGGRDWAWSWAGGRETGVRLEGERLGVGLEGERLELGWRERDWELGWRERDWELCWRERDWELCWRERDWAWSFAGLQSCSPWTHFILLFCLSKPVELF